MHAVTASAIGMIAAVESTIPPIACMSIVISCNTYLAAAIFVLALLHKVIYDVHQLRHLRTQASVARSYISYTSMGVAIFLVYDDDNSSVRLTACALNTVLSMLDAVFVIY